MHPNQRRPWLEAFSKELCAFGAGCCVVGSFPKPTAAKAMFTETEENRYAELQALALDYARSGETQALAAMLRHGLPVNLADAKGNSLLMLASYHGELET